MSRLDSFIRRMSAQRDCLNHVADLLADVEGPVMELGLGNGRTYDHLRERMPGRRVVAFDRAFAAHLPTAPATDDLVLGEIAETAQAFVGIGAALVHADIGTGYEDKDALTLRWLPQLIAGLLRSGGISASGLPLDHEALEPMIVPPGVPKDRYFLYLRK
ncbi:MAG: class I SAM-dependent methyltransferase [Rhizobiaceae bacterium]|nr:class I SAM-dependent methyltransferase [Rhizobiaceae bacterium]